MRTAIALLVFVSGCSLEPVRPWEKGDLARPYMQFDPDRLEARFDRQMFQSREAASGGYMIGGGGCGCN
jgi:hypothetical protein